MGDREQFLLDEAAGWVREGLIGDDVYQRLRERYAPPPAEARRAIVVRAALAIGVVLILLGTARLFADLHLSFLALTGVQLSLAAGCLTFGRRWHGEDRESRAAHALIYLAAMFFLGAIGLGGYTFEMWDRFNSPWLVLFGGLCVGALGWGFRFARLHGIGVLLVCIAAGIWLQRFGMPARWVPLVLGLAVAAIGFVMRFRALPDVRMLYIYAGLGAAALTGWALELASDDPVRWAYAILFTVLAAAPLAAGMRENDDLLAGGGILLLVLDIYTQYYYLLWSLVPRTVFFLVGGLLTLGFGIGYERVLRGKRPTELLRGTEGEG